MEKVKVSGTNSARTFELIGPDGITTTTVTDEAGRVTTLLRDDTQITAVYDDANRLTEIDYASGAKVLREYDEANWLTAIEHQDASETTILRLEHSWTPEALVESISETDPVLPCSATQRSASRTTPLTRRGRRAPRTGSARRRAKGGPATV